MHLRSELTLRIGVPADDVVCARNFSRMWQDIDISANELRDDFIPGTLDRIRVARATSAFRSIIAEIDGAIVGSACTNLTDDYPIYTEAAKRTIGCGLARLRASSTGAHVYCSLGFTASNEMERRLDERG